MQKLEMLIKTVDAHYDSLHQIQCYYLSCSLLNIARGTCNMMIVNEHSDFKNKITINKKTSDISEPKFSINSEEQKISVTANEGNFLTEDEIALEKNVIFKSNKFKIYTDNVVFNKKTYPLFTSLLDNLGVKYENSNMSFSVFSKENNFEYNGTTLNSLFSQRRNLLSPRFLKMIFEILRFNKESIKLKSKTILLKQYLKNNNYSAYFCKNYILPMGAAIWSSDIKTILNFPAHFFIDFFNVYGSNLSGFIFFKTFVFNDKIFDFDTLLLSGYCNSAK